MSLRKIAVLLAAGGLAVGLIGGGVGAQFTDQVQALQNINVGTFSCVISDGGGGVISNAGHTVTYSDFTIMSSAAGSDPFSFTVQNTGSIPDVLTVTPSGLGDPAFSVIGDPFAPVPLAAGATHLYSTGVQWTELSNANLGEKGSVTLTVNCGEQAGAAAGTAIFDNLPPANDLEDPNLYYSESLGALSETQFGTQVGFSGSARNLQTVTVAMSSWTCQSGGWNGNPGPCATTPGATFSVPITFSVYNVGTNNAVGSVITSKTQSFAIPYRPSSDPSCPATGGQTPAGYAFRAANGSCQNGLTSEITFSFSGVTLPTTDPVIFGIAYSPTGDAGSLNVLLYPSTADVPTPTQPAVGTFPLPSDTYADHTSGTTFPFQLNNAGGYGGIQPAVQFTATN